MTDGLWDGGNDGARVGKKVGSMLGGRMGFLEGIFVGNKVGGDVGFPISFKLGESVGIILGAFVGRDVGFGVGFFDGLEEGMNVGLKVGSKVGLCVGTLEGLKVTGEFVISGDCSALGSDTSTGEKVGVLVLNPCASIGTNEGHGCTGERVFTDGVGCIIGVKITDSDVGPLSLDVGLEVFESTGIAGLKTGLLLATPSSSK
mmetsp:Transcript_21766/g.44202  ORF Transcript_21766/g.44202 Transcript_21766/m.44202 type:complete len:202 (+) Transcript_21766:1033-1638(+)